MRRSFRLLLSAAGAASLLFLASCGGTVEVEACSDIDTADECRECCEDEGFAGHSYGRFSVPSCECRTWL